MMGGAVGLVVNTTDLLVSETSPAVPFVTPRVEVV
jgi:hypothetical protein